MAYDPKLGYDPDKDYTAAYAVENDPINRGRIADERGKKKAAMQAAGTYDPSWDTSWNTVYGANPLVNAPNAPIGQMGLGNSNPYNAANGAPSGSINPYTSAYNTATTQLGNMKKEQIGQVNSMYDKQAMNAYVQREQQTKNLPTQLAAQGITGGMAESSAVRIGTAYGNNIATNEAARMGAVSNINIASSQQAIDMALAYADRIIAQQNADRSFERGVLESDRGFAYQQNRDAVGDSQWNKSFDRGVLESDRGFNYQQGRDTVADNRYNTEWNYGVGRDNIADQRYTNETAYNRGRDTVGDQQWQQQFGYNAYRDNVGDQQWQQQFGYNQQQDAIANAYRQQSAQETATPYSMSGYAKNLVDTYAKSEGKYDLIGSLNKAYDSGLISAQDYAAALIQTGIDPNAKEKAAASAQATEANKANAYATMQNWTDNPANLGYGPLSQDKLQQLINDGKVIGKYENGRFYYKRP